MKKIIMTAALSACASLVFAQATVTSANIVGYNKDVSNPGLHMSGYQFLGDDTTPAGVFGDQLPIGTKISVFNGANYDNSTYEIYFDFGTFMNVTNWNPNTLDLGLAKGFWVENTGASVATAVLSGEVQVADSVTNEIVIGLQQLSYPYPVARNVLDLDFTPSIGDKISVYNGSNYDTSTYEIYFDFGTFMNVTNWNPSAIDIAVGQGFWYEAVSAQTWVANKPF
ncbi:hypothetical protein P4E94_00160 [Pontiellaceae bacterium B12219]|nr:hypothetical protein [Pontiellaceae bacterium B12219]